MTSAKRRELEADAILEEAAKEDEDFAEIERLLATTGEHLEKAEAKANRALEKIQEARRHVG